MAVAKKTVDCKTTVKYICEFISKTLKFPSLAISELQKSP